jgi:hypothetical protein
MGRNQRDTSVVVLIIPYGLLWLGMLNFLKTTKWVRVQSIKIFFFFLGRSNFVCCANSDKWSLIPPPIIYNDLIEDEFAINVSSITKLVVIENVA